MFWRRKLKRTKVVIYHPLFDPIHSPSHLAITLSLATVTDEPSEQHHMYSESCLKAAQDIREVCVIHLCQFMSCMLHYGTWESETKDRVHLSLMACLFSANLCFMVGLWVSEIKRLMTFLECEVHKQPRLKEILVDNYSCFNVQTFSDSVSLNWPILLFPQAIIGIVWWKCQLTTQEVKYFET